MVLLFRRIPRGRGRAPEAVRPASNVSRETALAAAADVRRALAAIADRSPDFARASGRSSHFAFGALDAGQWLLFALIHTRHHFAIIRDIERERDHDTR